jgi:hypothetical protein
MHHIRLKPCRTRSDQPLLVSAGESDPVKLFDSEPWGAKVVTNCSRRPQL